MGLLYSLTYFFLIDNIKGSLEALFLWKTFLHVYIKMLGQNHKMKKSLTKPNLCFQKSNSIPSILTSSDFSRQNLYCFTSKMDKLKKEEDKS